jgi:hypothetical protein
LFTVFITGQRAVFPVSTSQSLNVAFPIDTGSIWLEKVWCDLWVNTTNDGTRYWNIVGPGATNFTTQSRAIDTVHHLVATPAPANALVAQGNWLQADVNIVSTPGSLYPHVACSYRLVGV